MRGTPQVLFSRTIRKISSRTSADSCFLPTCFFAFEIKLQYSRNPARCQRTTVSGLTSTRDCFQAPQKRRANNQKIFSTTSIPGFGCLRFSTASCCRRTRFFQEQAFMRLQTAREQTQQNTTLRKKRSNNCR